MYLEVDMVIKNPGISWDNKYIKQALNKKISVEMDSSLFFKLCKNNPPDFGRSFCFLFRP